MSKGQILQGLLRPGGSLYYYLKGTGRRALVTVSRDLVPIPFIP